MTIYWSKISYSIDQFFKNFFTPDRKIEFNFFIIFSFKIVLETEKVSLFTSNNKIDLKLRIQISNISRIFSLRIQKLKFNSFFDQQFFHNFHLQKKVSLFPSNNKIDLKFLIQMSNFSRIFPLRIQKFKCNTFSNYQIFSKPPIL